MSELIAFIAGMFVAAIVCCNWLGIDAPTPPSSMQYSLGFEHGYRKAKEDYKRKEEEGNET